MAAGAVVFAVLRLVGPLSVARIAFVAATLRVERGISLCGRQGGASRRASNSMAAGEAQKGRPLRNVHATAIENSK